MPTKMKQFNNQWQARVWSNGQQVASRLFPGGRKGGPEWREAKRWEEEQRKLYQSGKPILTDLERLMNWGELFLAETARRTSHKDQMEKQLVMQTFYAFCRMENIKSLDGVTPAKASKFLAGICDNKGAKRANKYRTRLITAWNYGVSFIDGFSQIIAPFKKVPKFPADKPIRYVPPDVDVMQVMQCAQGQDLVMLFVFYYTGARANEVFKLLWSTDLNLADNKIRLVDHKMHGGGQRERWLPLHPELLKALSWWHDTRPCKVDNVFFQQENDTHKGEPYKHRNRLMPALCKRAGVKPFGFHSLRRKSATIAFSAQGLGAAQMLMGHYRASTTDIYVESWGLYADRVEVVDSLGKNSVGEALGNHFSKMVMPQNLADSEAFCKPAVVNQQPL
jgi:integrase